jgi:hypothetical protein
MNATATLAQLQSEHVVMELECIDRMYLNAYVPLLTSEGGIAAFCRGYLGQRFASTKQAVPMTKAFLQAIDAFLQRKGLELVRFRKRERKDDVMQKELRRFKKSGKAEGVVFVGVAQEKVRVPRTTRKHFGGGGTILALTFEPERTLGALKAEGAADCLQPAPSPGVTCEVVEA